MRVLRGWNRHASNVTALAKSLLIRFPNGECSLECRERSCWRLLYCQLLTYGLFERTNESDRKYQINREVYEGQIRTTVGSPGSARYLLAENVVRMLNEDFENSSIQHVTAALVAWGLQETGEYRETHLPWFDLPISNEGVQCPWEYAQDTLDLFRRH